MKKKILYLSFISTLLLGCNENTTPNLNWSTTIQNEMIEYLGEVLPYADFNLDTLEAEYTELTIEDYGENGNNYTLTDDNEINVVSDYGDKLIQNGFIYQEDDGYGYECYVKETSKGQLVVYANWFPETMVLEETALAGNQIDAYLYFKN